MQRHYPIEAFEEMPYDGLYMSVSGTPFSAFATKDMSFDKNNNRSDDMSDEELIHRYNHCKKYYEGNTILLLRDKQCGSGEDDYEVLLGCNGWGSDVIAYVDL